MAWICVGRICRQKGTENESSSSYNAIDSTTKKFNRLHGELNVISLTHKKEKKLSEKQI